MNNLALALVNRKLGRELAPFGHFEFQCLRLLASGFLVELLFQKRQVPEYSLGLTSEACREAPQYTAEPENGSLTPSKSRVSK